MTVCNPTKPTFQIKLKRDLAFQEPNPLLSKSIYIHSNFVTVTKIIKHREKASGPFCVPRRCKVKMVETTSFIFTLIESAFCYKPINLLYTITFLFYFFPLIFRHYGKKQKWWLMKSVNASPSVSVCVRVTKLMRQF